MAIWKEVPGTKGRILVSDEGEMKSLLRDGRILKAQPDTKGYLRVRVTLDREKKTFKVHREVAKAFLRRIPGKNQINHIDGNKNNNSVENLEWVSNVENAQHAINTGLWNNVFLASARSNASRMQPIVSTDLATGEKRRFPSVSEAERYFNSRHISDVLNGKRNAAAGQHFAREGVVK